MQKKIKNYKIKKPRKANLFKEKNSNIYEKKSWYPNAGTQFEI
jgi:hypothetical protein